MKPTYKVSKSFLIKLIKKASDIKSNDEMLDLCQYVLDKNVPILMSDDIDLYDSEQNAEDLESDNLVPEHLSKIKNALIGAISSTDDED